MSTNRGPILYFILVLALLAINGFLFSFTFQSKKKSEEVAQQKAEALALVDELNDEIDDYILRLETYKSDNEGLISIRDSLKTVVLNKQKDIQRALHDKNFTSKKLDETRQLLSDARLEIEELVDEKDDYVAQLDSMSTAYNALLTEFDSLTSQYSNQITQTRIARQEASEVRNMATLMTATNLSGIGVRKKRDGYVEAPRAKRAEKLQICFNLLENRLVEPGEQTLHLKIIGPQGVTLAENNTVFLDKENGQESVYTARYTLAFKNEPIQQFCTYYQQSGEFSPGLYVVNLYHRGYMIAETSLELK